MRRLRAALKLAGILAALAAVPMILHRAAGNPLPGWPIDWGLVAESLSTGAVATSTWLQVVAVVGWLVWGYLIVALTLDVAATIRGRRSPVRAAPVQWLASTMVALATQLSTVSMAASPTPVTVDVRAAAASFDPADTADTSPVGEDIPEGTRLVVVTEGDSWAGFAQSVLGDAAAGPEVRRLNDSRDVGTRTLDGSEAFVEAGWRLLVPAVTDAAHAAATNGDHQPEPATNDGQDADADEWTVQEGEHFWTIAEATLEDAHDAPPSEDEVAAYWRELVDANEDRLLPPQDPDLIYPGQTLIVPPVEATADTTARVEPPTDERPPNVDEQQLPDRLAPQPSAPSDNGRGPAASEDDGDDLAETDSLAAPDDQTHADAGDPDHHTPVEAARPGRTSWDTPVGLAAGTAATTLLGGGVLALLRRRRRVALQQRPVQVRLPPLTDAQAAQAARLDVAAASGEVLDELADLLCSIPDHVCPVLVAADDNGSVTVTFDPADQPPAPPPAPWADDRSDGGQSERWTATVGDRGPRRSIGLPLLVTLGRDGTSIVLGNVAVMRLLTVHGSEAAVGRQLRAFALEVATSHTAGPVEVLVAGGDDRASIQQLRRIEDAEAEIAAAADEVAQGIVADDRLPRLIVCHDAAAVPHLPEHVDLVGIIAAHDRDTGGARWRLDLDGPRRVLHQPDGRQIVLGTPDFDPDLVTDELAALDPIDLPLSDVEERDEVGVLQTEDVDRRGWCEVALLGPVGVTRGDQPLDTLTPILRQVLAYLATHPGTTTEQLEDAVWAGQAAASGQRVRAALKRLRTVMGTTPDGEALVPRRGPGDHTLHLSAQVTTDLDRAFGHLEAAHRLDGNERLARLLAALDLVRGTPFQDLPVSWAVDIEHRAIARIQDAALEAATSLLDAGRLDEAEHAVQQGLKLCDPSEPLYVAWARIERARGRGDRIPQLWTRLRQHYADDADDADEMPATPTADTERAFAELTGAHRGAE